MMETFGPQDVFLDRAPVARYELCEASPMPELPSGVRPTTALVTFRQLLERLPLDAAHRGTAAWNPLADILGEGRKVLLKPNWVFHSNQTGKGEDCLVTHRDLIEAVLHYVGKTNPERVTIGDAPLQGCDFVSLRRGVGIDDLLAPFASLAMPVTIADFRRTILQDNASWRDKREACRDVNSYVLFDIGKKSSLEPITNRDAEFRVTMYDPRSVEKTHGAGRHQYLIAREAIDADVVVNMPKLKTHKKSCVTGAIKNLVGINGHKEYLPHHRKGSADGLGDCYQRGNWLKQRAEDCLDWMNASRFPVSRYTWSKAASMFLKFDQMLGGDGDVEGSWHGNDTIWRTCLDLQRILIYGRLDGTLAERPQRVVLNVTDAIIAGEGEGPLAPEPVGLGLLTFGLNAAAVEWVHAALMGFDPQSIPLIREAFSPHSHPLTFHRPEGIRVWLGGRSIPIDRVFDACGRHFRPPRGWQGHCERRERRTTA